LHVLFPSEARESPALRCLPAHYVLDTWQPFDRRNHRMLHPFLSLQRYAQLSGRSGRKEYWSFRALSALAIGTCLGVHYAGIRLGSNVLALAGLILLGVVWLSLVVPDVSVTVRRLHDLDQSGWYLLVSLVPVGPLILLIMLLVPGQVNVNRFGPPVCSS
jgi:uncharacterized membrane protein YhaH (DUF805 family)